MCWAWYNSAVDELVAEPWEGRYLRKPRPLYFPTTEHVPETRRHYELRTALFQILKAAFSERATVGCDQFVYWNPQDPKACLAPDVMLRLGEPDAPFDSWEIWERGAPQLAVEILSKGDREKLSWKRKLERYAQTGIRELVRFDADKPAKKSLRIWDLFEGDLVERNPKAQNFFRCRTLGVFYDLRKDEKLGLVLGLARDGKGNDPLLTPDELRERAEARVRELEAELARRRG